MRSFRSSLLSGRKRPSLIWTRLDKTGTNLDTTGTYLDKTGTSMDKTGTNQTALLVSEVDALRWGQLALIQVPTLIIVDRFTG